MASEERWATSVRDLVLNFRDALAALTPYMDRVKIGWRDAEAYDDWDEIAQGLYENMVLRSILYSIGQEEGLSTPEYGMVYPSYQEKSFIEVGGDASPRGKFRVFVGFSTLEHPFDQVRYQLVSGLDLRAAGNPTCIPLGDANFVFIVNKGDQDRERLSDILVQV
jgi:hypothetical protein